MGRDKPDERHISDHDQNDQHKKSRKITDPQELNIDSLVHELAESAYRSRFFPIKQYKILPGNRRKKLLHLVDALTTKFIDRDFCEDYYDLRYVVFTYTNKEKGEFLILKAHHDAHSAIVDHNLAEECTTANVLNDAK